jgi:hypothetical protein
MVDTPNRNNGTPDTTQAGRNATQEEVLAAKLPPTETEQPDPMLQMSVGRMGAGSITLATVAAAVVLAVVLYGLNSPTPNSAAPNSAPAAPAAGGKAGPPATSGQETGVPNRP